MGLLDKIKAQLMSKLHEVKLDKERQAREPCILHLSCPICACAETHFYGSTRFAADGYGRGESPVQGPVLSIRGECEDGCLFDIYFGQHKGDTFVWAQAATQQEGYAMQTALEEARKEGFNEALRSAGWTPPKSGE